MNPSAASTDLALGGILFWYSQSVILFILLPSGVAGSFYPRQDFCEGSER